MDIRQNTATTVWVGPFLSTDGVSHSTGLTVVYYIAKNNGTFVATTGTNSESTGMVAFYKCPLTATNVDTLGNLKIAAQSSSEFLSVWDDFSVVTANYYDTRYGTDEFQVDVVQVIGSTSGADDLEGLVDDIAGLNDISTTDILTQAQDAVDASTEIDDIATVLGALNDVSTTDILTQAQDAVDASTEIDDIATLLGALNDISTTDILTQAQDAVDASTEIDDIATAIAGITLTSTDILTQSEIALAAHAVDGSITMDTALKEMNGKLNHDSFKDSNEYKFYDASDNYLFSLTISSTARVRSS